MPSIEELKRKAQSAVFAAKEKAQDAAAAAGEGAVTFRGFASEKAGAVRTYVSEKAALVAEKRSLTKNYLALGEWYAAQCGEDVPEGAADIINAIRASQAKIAELTVGAKAAADGLDDSDLDEIARETEAVAEQLAEDAVEEAVEEAAEQAGEKKDEEQPKD